jgi:acyl-coenzyme A thioesterase PaaI-like protein
MNMMSKQLPQISLFILTTAAALRRKRLARLPKLLEPYRQRFHGDPLHVCYGCSHTNPKSLRLDFFTTDVGGLACRWSPAPGLESFPNIVHGGLSATILDELGGVAIQRELDAFALTASSRINFHAPAYTDRQLFGHARIAARLKRYVLVEAELYDEKGKILSSMSALYFIPPKGLFKHLTKLETMSPEVASYVAD